MLNVQNKDYTVAGTDDVATAAATGASDLAAHVAASDPHTGYQKESEKAAANGYASLDSGMFDSGGAAPGAGRGFGLRWDTKERRRRRPPETPRPGSS